MAAIQLMSPVPLTVLWRTPGGHDLETALHVRFDAQWIHGEWFDFGEQVSEFAIEESFLKPEFRPVELPVTTAEIIRLARESLNEP